MIANDTRKALTAWEPISSCIISATFKTCNTRVKAHIIQCYAPTNDSDDEVKAKFYDGLNHLFSSSGARDLIILMEAKMNENSVFPHKKSIKQPVRVTQKPNSCHRKPNQPYYINKKFRRTMQGVGTRCGTDLASDYPLLMGKFKLRLKRHDQPKGQRVKYNTDYLSNAQVMKQSKHIK